MFDPNGRYLTIAECAKYLHVSADTVRRRIADGHLIATRPAGSRRWYVTLDDLFRYIDAGRNDKGTDDDDG